MSSRPQSPAQSKPTLDGRSIRLSRAVWRIPMEDLAAEAGVSVALVSLIERGDRNLTRDVRRRIMGALAKLIEAASTPDEAA